MRAPKHTDPHKAYAAGIRAKKNHWSRELCPFNDVTGEFYFRAGFDGVTLESIMWAGMTINGVTANDPIFRLKTPVLVTDCLVGWNETGVAIFR